MVAINYSKPDGILMLYKLISQRKIARYELDVNIQCLSCFRYIPGNNPLQHSSINKLLQDKEQASTHMGSSIASTYDEIYSIREDKLLPFKTKQRTLQSQLTLGMNEDKEA